MKSRVFIDDLLENKIRENGYVKIPFWNQKIVNNIRHTFASEFYEHHASFKKFHTTYETFNVELIDRVKDYLEPFFLEKTTSLFANMSPISASFLVKEPGLDSESPLHQDASFVDETDYCSVSIWVALQDCNMENSCLQFIPGSHNLFTSVRYIPYLNPTIDIHKKRLTPFLTRHSIKAGDAYVFYNSTLHGSGNNFSKNPRLAAVMSFYSSNTQLCIYKKNDKTNKIDRYSITVEQLKQINDVLLLNDEQRIQSIEVPLGVETDAVTLFLRKRFSLPERILAFANQYLKLKIVIFSKTLITK